MTFKIINEENDKTVELSELEMNIIAERVGEMMLILKGTKHKDSSLLFKRIFDNITELIDNRNKAY